MSDVLLITVVGMGLVFSGIILLWGLIALLMGIDARLQRPADPVLSPEAADEDTGSARRARAAALAVAAAVALDTLRPPTPRPHSLPLISAWQAVLRTNQLKRGRR